MNTYQEALAYCQSRDNRGSYDLTSMVDDGRWWIIRQPAESTQRVRVFHTGLNDQRENFEREVFRVPQFVLRRPYRHVPRGWPVTVLSADPAGVTVKFSARQSERPTRLTVREAVNLLALPIELTAVWLIGACNHERIE